MILTVTLVFAACCALLNLWLAVRIGRVRIAGKVMHGDGGNPLLARRIRAQLNFVENTAFVLVLVGLIELAQGASLWLWLAALIYIAARIAHGFGMDAERAGKLRSIGVLATMLLTVILVIWALAIAYGAIGV